LRFNPPAGSSALIFDPLLRNRTKFHVKHFGPIGAENLTKPKRPDKIEMEFGATLTGDCKLWIVSWAWRRRLLEAFHDLAERAEGRFEGLARSFRDFLSDTHLGQTCARARAPEKHLLSAWELDYHLRRHCFPLLRYDRDRA
jgi:hypothetical protein